MSIVLPYVMIPLLSGFVFPSIAGDTDPANVWNQFNYFVEALMWVSMFGIPSVCLHVEAVSGLIRSPSRIYRTNAR